MKMYSVAPLALAVSLSLGVLSGCSSSGSSSTDASISGTIVAAPINGADVSVVDGSGNVVAGPVQTNDAGQYTLSIPEASLTQDLILKSSGGTFNDEATGSNGNAGEMLAYVVANSLSDGGSVCATPGSTIIANMVMNQSMDMTQAQTAFQNAFGYTPDVTINPVDATVTNADASDESKLAGLRAAAFSQLAMDLGLKVGDVQDPAFIAEQFDLFTALADDLSVGSLDGVGSTGAVNVSATVQLEANIQNRFSMALVNFHDSGQMGDTHSNDLTGLTSDQIGNVPFAKVALTDTYKIVYSPIGMGEKAGKTKFTLTVTDINNPGADTSGLSIAIKPMMHMAAMTHTSAMPEANAVVDNNDGTYTGTVYYVMTTAMNGFSMGYWDLAVTIDDTETANFYPNVMMAMGDTTLTKLKGVDDQVMSMVTNSMEGRTYFVFKDDLTGDSGSYDLSLFLATKESMDNFPALTTGLILNQGNMMSELAVDCPNIVVSVSVNDGSWNPAASDCTDGLWTIGVTLNDGMGDENKVRVRLTVNNEVKTTDGNILDIINPEPTNADLQTFTITPNPSMSM
ncbi:MAG: hypothetical protein DIZ80_13580 [endosymbiont of Galathealinum brachiosum]|uniref:Carboxypeptidase regulatory-like domain-containing protein n=1 Tax=endosymbiont of Galathealinum brachiosum TaxID=2200906 RepID=A0A370D8A6_9GAMM|nr:MAG: hypothetical protein DIZ80_13580 [endosymbiont of Galathealinum brachiosum]